MDSNSRQELIERLKQAQGRVVLFYDGDCPVCNSYCRVLKIREDFGDLGLINVRENREFLSVISALAIDMNEGFVVLLDDQVHHGAEALHVLALISGKSSTFNRFNHWLFRSETRSQFTYPVLRAGRNLLLRMLRREPISDLARETEPSKPTSIHRSTSH